jgi:hypothetical protein
MARPDDTEDDVAYAELGEIVRARLEIDADEVDARKFHAMWREIDKAIDQEAPASAWGRLVGWLDRHRGNLITGAVTAGAVAAIAMMIRPAPTIETRTIVERAPAGALDVQPAALRAPPEIEDIETSDGEATVINLEDEDGHTAVIWVTAADTVEGI